MPWDGVNATIYGAPDISTYQPRKVSVKGRKTCTADLCILMNEASENKQALSNRQMIAKALEKENLLHTIHTIQISTNNRFASIEFRRKKDLEGFCKDGLAFDNFETKVYFHPYYKQRPTERKYLSVFFLNVPTEADQDKMTRFVEQYFTVIGEPYYPKEEYNGIYYWN